MKGKEEINLIVGFNEAATKTSPKFMAKAGRNLCRCASHPSRLLSCKIALARLPALIEM